MAKAGELDWSDLAKSNNEYSVSHEMSPKGLLTVTAKHKNGDTVGTATFSHNNTTDKIIRANREEFNIRGLSPEMTNVHPDHRRKGVATMMYEHASKIMNQKIAQPPKEHQTEDAKLMWEKRNKLSKTWPDWSKEEQVLKSGKKIQLQATNQQLFGHLVVNEEQFKKNELDYENKINDWYKSANTNIDNKQTDWGNNKSFNSTLTEEERLKRNMHIGDSE